METHEEHEVKNSAGDEITGLNAEETYKAEKTLNKDLFITVEVDTQGIKGSADRIMNALIWGDKKEFYDNQPN